MAKLRAFIAEFIGTFALIYVGILVSNHVLGSANNMGLTAVALAHGLTIACLASATAAVSGGHLNPAVTFGMLLTRRIGFGPGIIYIFAQLLGGVAGGYLAMVSLPEGSGVEVLNGLPALAQNLRAEQAVLVEAILTFFLVFVIMGTAVDKRAPRVGALFVGLAVTLGVFAGGPLTGAAMNPARWFGAAVPASEYAFSLVYIAGPLVGAAAAALVYSAFMEDKAPIPLEDPVRVDA